MLSPVSAQAITIYYVDNTNTQAADNASHGSSGLPFKTVTYAVSVMAGGDKVIVSGGTSAKPYTNEFIQIPNSKSGSQSTPTTIQAAAGTRPLIKANNSTAVFQMTSANWVTISGFEVVNDFDSGPAPNYGGGTYGGGCGIRGVTWCSHITIYNNIVHGCGSAGISFEDRCDYITVNNNEVYGCAVDSPFHTSGISLLNMYP